jgi:hypothetical protein
MNGVQKCEKCPIEYKSCETNNEVCFYSDLPTQLNPTNCKWNDKKSNFTLIKDFVSEYFGNTDEFTGSLFSVNGASSTYKCGDYSIIGLAGRG